MNPVVLRLAQRQLWAQLRTVEWRALVLATWLAITLTTFLSLLSDRLEQGLLRESASVLGADLVLRSSRPIDDLRELAAKEAGLTTTRVIQFPTMVGAGDNLVLSSARIVSSPYPLRGEIVTQPAQQTPVPEPGTAWVEPRILEQLQIDVGDSIQFGYVDLVVSARLLTSPDRGSGFRSLSPHVLVNQQDLEASGVLAPGSRAQFRLLMSGADDQIAAFERQLTPELEQYERILSLTSDQPVTGNALGNGMSYLRLSALTALLLSALTIMLALRRFSNGQQTRSALLMSLGLQPKEVIQLYLWQLLIAAGVIGAFGTLSGILFERIADYWIADLLPQALPTANWWSYLSGAGLGFAMLILLGLPPTLEQSQVPVAQLLRGEDLKARTGSGRSLYAISLGLLGGTILLFLQAPLAAFLLLLALAVCGVLFGWLAQQTLHWLAKPLAKRMTLGRLLKIRLSQQRRWHRLQSAVVILLLTLLSVVWVSRQDLIQEWQAQFPDDVPNYFVINIQDWQKPALDDFLDQRQIETELYPMIRGRLMELNDAPIRPQLNEEQLKDNSLGRELNLTWRDTLPGHNQLLAGEWWSPDSTEPEISIERDMLEDLGLKLGDRLGFDVGGQPVSGTITSIREVQWESFRPNFYVIFSRPALESYPGTWITSFKLDDDKRTAATDLLREFPSLTLIDIDQLLEQLAGWLERLADSSAMVLGLTLACGLILIAVTLLQALEQRRFEAALLQTLGSTSKQTQKLDLLEFALLGAVCGALAAVSAELILAALHQNLLRVDVRLHPELWLSLPPLAVMLFVGIGFALRAPLRIEQCYAILRNKS
ncbi:MAG TPA: FtsX-like permease family protein [Marinobacterium sp.]|nr:FtsX-like permease family protein [Marinobacterium sp.]